MDDPHKTQEYLINNFKTVEFHIDDIRESEEAAAADPQQTAPAPSDAPSRESDACPELPAEMLENVKERYQELLASNLYGIQEIDVYGNIVYANAVQSRILGYSREELKQRQIWDLLASDRDRDELTAYLTRVAEREEVPVCWMGRYLRKDQKPLELKCAWSARRNDKDEVIGFVSVISDLYAEEPAQPEPSETGSAEAHERYRLIIDAVREVIVTFDMIGRITYVNPRGMELIGYSEQELLNMNIADILPPDQLDGLGQVFSATENSDVLNYEATFISRDFELIPVEINASITTKDGTPADVLLMAREMGSRRLKERQRIQESKYQCTATLAEGLAGDLSRIFTQTVKTINTARTLLKPEGRAFQRLTEAKAFLSQMEPLIRRFLSLTDMGAPLKTPTPLSDRLSGPLEKALKGSPIESQLDLPSDLWLVAADPAQLESALYELFKNLRELAPEAKRLAVFARNTELEEEPEPPAGGLAPGPYVKLAVENPEFALSAPQMERLFDPYFTPRETGYPPGRGLGLSLVRAVLRKQGGDVEAEAGPAGATRLLVWMPAAPNAPESASAGPPYRGRVLVMDDEPLTRELAGGMLRQLGFQAVFAEDGAKALELYKKSVAANAPIDLFILDLDIRGGMGGREVVQRLLKTDPDIRAVACGDYANDPEMKELVQYGFAGVMDKPYRMRELKQTIENVLDQSL